MRIKFLCVLFVAALTLAFSRADASIVFNVDFESGNTGFQSDYTYYTPTTPVGMIPEDNYSIVAKPTDVHTLWYSFYDHTFGDGTGHMMVVNGSTTEGDRVWFKDIAMETGVTYVLTAWAASVYPQNPANLEFKLGTNSLGTMQLPSTAGVWQEFTATFVAGEGEGQIAAIDLVLAYSGNDFALDDVSLVAVPEPTTLLIWSVLGVLGAVAYSRRK